MAFSVPGDRGARRYKGYRIYAFIALSRLFAELNLDVGQADLLARVDAGLSAYQGRVSKEEILHAIRSNSHMTEKVLEYLSTEGFATVHRDEQGYDIRITRAGVEHLREYHRFYRDLYGRELAEHYRYVRSPDWLTRPP
jgi:predicted transcriptional regulator